MKTPEEKRAAAMKAREEAMKAKEEKKAAAKKATKKETNATVCRQQYQEQYHNGPQEMPIVVPMNDEMLGIIDTLREGQFTVTPICCKYE